MCSDFSFSYNKPFKLKDIDRCWDTILDMKENGVELKINNVEVDDILNSNIKKGKLVDPKILYLVDSKLNTFTLLNTFHKSSTYRAISYSTVYASKYVMGLTQPEKEIIHFTKGTKIKKIYYYQNDLNYIFNNPSVFVKRKFVSNSKYISVEAKRKKDILMGNITIDNNEVKVFLINSFNVANFTKNINVVPTNYIRLEFKHYINFDFAYKIKRRIDAILHILIFTNNISNKLEFVDTKKNRFTYFDLDNKYNERSLTLPSFNTKNTELIFIKLFDLFLNMPDEEINTFLPFLDFYRNKPSVEIEFLEYYRMLELIAKIKNQELQKGKNQLFTLQLIRKYPYLKKQYFGNQPDEELEEELRELRNYYSHEGYYLDILPITKNKQIIRYKNVNSQWKVDTKNFIKKIAYLEIYNMAEIQIDEKEFISNVPI